MTNNSARRYFRKMLGAFSSPGIYTKYVQLPRADDPTPFHIADDPAVYPFFKDAIGAIDKTHIACAPSVAEREVTRCRTCRNRSIDARVIYYTYLFGSNLIMS